MTPPIGIIILLIEFNLFVRSKAMDNGLIHALREEINRNKELLREYARIPQGAFGAHLIQQDIMCGENAINTMNTVEMVKVLSKLRQTN